MITGRDLIDAGFPQGPEFGAALEHLKSIDFPNSELKNWVSENAPEPRVKPQAPIKYNSYIESENDLEEANVQSVKSTFEELLKTPTIRYGSIMPDACPAGPLGTIPVGGVVAAENAIHPGMHSADICCSVMATDFGTADPKEVLDAIHKATHFGPGGRQNGQRYTMSADLYDEFKENSFLGDKRILRSAIEHMGTQGDGNHFAFVGKSSVSGNTFLITHHGSRGPGAGLFKLGMRVAEKYRKKLSEGVLKQNAWIPYDTQDGADYWEALQLIRRWTKANHNCLHAATEQISGSKTLNRFWNEHNFVFKDDDLFWHAKGATPVKNDLLPDTNGIQIIPLNMAEPILFVKGEQSSDKGYFAPHGAGRNYSRTAHKKSKSGMTEDQIFSDETDGLDVRFFSGNIDISELPSAYKNAASVRVQMEKFKLATVVDEIQPYGSIMAGDWERDAPWRNKKEKT